jgi:hypothetical protein
LERDLKFLSANDIRRQAADLGLKPVQVWKALDPERKARLAKQRQQPFGTPIVPNSQLIASARLSDFGLRSATSWEE